MRTLIRQSRVVRRTVMAALGGAVLPLLVASAEAVDLTGTWEGRLVCQRWMDDQPPTTSREDVTVQISQGENVLRIFMEAAPGGLLLKGVAVDDGRRELTGRFSSLFCQSDPTDGAFSLNGNATTTLVGRGSLRADLAGFIGGIQPVVFDCTLTASRSDVADPAVPDCAP
jgi:hypothetical protein